MKTLSLQQMENVEGGRFWGWVCNAEINFPNGGCYRECTYYVLWKPILVEQLRSCSNLPGRYG